MKRITYLLVAFLLVSCGAYVDYDYEKTTDFSQYKTYNYFTNMDTGFSQLDNKRLFRVMDAKLKSMGFIKSENPSFNIDIQSSAITNNITDNVAIGVGGTGNNIGGGVSFGIPVGAYAVQREVIIEFVDDSKNGMFWQAVTVLSQTSNNTPEKREAAFVKLIEKIFSKYPPKS